MKFCRTVCYTGSISSNLSSCCFLWALGCFWHCSVFPCRDIPDLRLWYRPSFFFFYMSHLEVDTRVLECLNPFNDWCPTLFHNSASRSTVLCLFRHSRIVAGGSVSLWLTSTFYLATRCLLLLWGNPMLGSGPVFASSQAMLVALVREVIVKVMKVWRDSRNDPKLQVWNQRLPLKSMRGWLCRASIHGSQTPA